MKTKITIMVSAAFLLLFVGMAGAVQVLLPGATIPQFVEPLPLPPDITVVDATSGGLNTTTFDIAAVEFKSQILPTVANWAAAPATCTGVTSRTASWVWGYRVPGVDYAGTPYQPDPTIRQSYLGPVVVAERNILAQPQYLNFLPSPNLGGTASNVLPNLPIDMTLDWANPNNFSNCPTPTPSPGDVPYLDPACGLLPSYLGPEIPIATHLHGGEVLPAYDGGPDAWFTQNAVYTGAGFPGPTYNYPNEQQAGTIWFHDHALGITRLNVYAGLAGLYPIIDPLNEPPQAPVDCSNLLAPFFGCLPNAAYDIPLIIQDRSFDTTCQIFYNLASNPQPNPTVHPFWIPEFIGDTIVVNGKTWPFLEVEPRKYRFRLVNGSNARFYDLSLPITTTTQVPTGKSGKFKQVITNVPVPFTVIATDDGYLQTPVNTPNLIIGPGERYEVVVDFTLYPFNSNVIMMNAAWTPFPAGAPPVVGTTDRVMQFRINLSLSGIAEATMPLQLRDPGPNPIHRIFNGVVPPSLPPAPFTGNIVRQLTLNEVIGKGGPLELVVNNSKFNLALANFNCPGGLGLCRETELPAVGDTEVWEIINITADAHPMHTHLVSFQLIDRTPIPNLSRWINNYDGLLKKNGVLPGYGPPNLYYIRNADGAIGGNPAVWNGPRPAGIPRLNYEDGWKDTVITYPGEVTRIAVRWATTDIPVGGVLVGTNTYPFDPTGLFGGTLAAPGVGYVWHCHIIDHEDNEMMRNYAVGVARQFVQ